MAIKGKKRSKGGSSPRRPAAAPRPQIPIARTKRPFYKTRDGMFIIGIFVLVAIGVAIWLIGGARDKAREKKAEQTAVQAYTDQVQPALVDAGTVISDMNGLAALPEKDDDSVKTDSEDWSQRLQEVQITFSQLVVSIPPEVQPFHNLFNAVIAQYLEAAKTFGQIADIDDADLRGQLFTTASTQRDLATAMFESAIEAFDSYRVALDMGASGLTAPPAGLPPQEQPVEEITTEPSP